MRQITEAEYEQWAPYGNCYDTVSSYNWIYKPANPTVIAEQLYYRDEASYRYLPYYGTAYDCTTWAYYATPKGHTYYLYTPSSGGSAETKTVKVLAKQKGTITNYSTYSLDDDLDDYEIATDD